MPSPKKNSQPANQPPSQPAPPPAQPQITQDLIARHGLSPEEYQRILTILGRTPTIAELGVFSVMWSEHCSYKNSKPELRKFPTDGPSVLVRAGEENAGVLDIGDGWAVAFKIESHNHPSAIEPFQGAATGVGGIIRDIFTMGARPVFLLNSLRFGEISGPSPHAKTSRRLFAGVVAGISHYGNCVGIPTIGGEIYFDDSYAGNPLVNVMCLGILRHNQIARGAARGEGNPVFYVGSETGRDGLAGAAFASRELTEESKQDRPAVQVGDPFREKLLLEACLELLALNAVTGIQDMGAAGLTCSTCETASRGGSGVEIELAKVPQREPGMTAYEILLSESQERMLIIAPKNKRATVRRVLQKWGLPCAEIGRVTSDGQMRVLHNGRTEVQIPARALADEAPVYKRQAKAPPPPKPLKPSQIPAIPPAEALPALLAHPTIACKRWVWSQYDHMVRLGAAVLPGSDAAVFWAREADKFLAATTDCNAIYCRLSPRDGARLAVAEAARNLACSGARPIGVTDNLNFGNPYKPENFWQLREAVEGMAEACRHFQLPVTGGNVSLYNESPSGTIDPTPTVAMVGLIADPAHITRQAFQRAGDRILLLGPLFDPQCPSFGMGGSHYLKHFAGLKAGTPPRLDLPLEKNLHHFLLDLITRGLVTSAHDCSEGGLAVALAEASLSAPLLEPATHTFPGASIHLPLPAGIPSALAKRPEILLFHEAPSRILISASPPRAATILRAAAAQKLPCLDIGHVTSTPHLTITLENHPPLTWPLDTLWHAWGETLETLMAR